AGFFVRLPIRHQHRITKKYTLRVDDIHFWCTIFETVHGKATMPTIKIHGNYTPAQRRTIRLALERRLVSDKAQAREEGVSPRSIGDRWDGIAHRLHLPFGQRERAQVIAELVVRKHIEVAVLALAILTS